ncbi:serine palmitoyltransferase 1-like isoform X1 [Haemaphysalis longicornis]
MELPWELYEMFEAFLQVPAYHLAFQVLLFLLASAVWLLFRKSPQASAQKSELTEKEKELIANLTLEPLASPTPPSDYVVNPGIISTEVGEQVVVDGHSFLNLASPNYLGIAELEGAEKAAIRGHRRYAVGSCGPRQFFGVVGVHLELERRLAELMGVEEACLYSFTGVEEACLYSFGFSTIPSVIPSYAKPGDICFADEDVNYAIHMGLLASGSKIYYFRHNDVQDLQRLLLEQQARDIADPKKAGITNRFLVVEGIYASRGDICPLPELVNLRRKFQLRLFIDETCSFAVLGHTGRGVREHFNVPSNEIDLMCATLEHGVGAFGGFFCGTRVVVHDQHLSGLGYFSASLPPEQASVSLQAIDYLSSHPELLTRLRQNCVRMHEQLQRIQQLRLGGEAVSPVKHLYIAGDRPKEDCSQLLDEVVRKAWEAGLALTRAPYLEDREHTPKDPSIRISVSASLTEEDIENACDVIRQVTEAVVDA